MKLATFITFTTVLTFLMLTSCRTSKHRIENLQSTQQVSSSESLKSHHYLQQDSTKSYWLFASDSAFYFHPDGGLWALGGRLYAEEQSAHKIEIQSTVSHKDSAVDQQYAVITEQKTIRQNQLPWYIYLVVVLGIGSVGGYYWWRKGF